MRGGAGGLPGNPPCRYAKTSLLNSGGYSKMLSLSMVDFVITLLKDFLFNVLLA